MHQSFQNFDESFSLPPFFNLLLTFIHQTLTPKSPISLNTSPNLTIPKPKHFKSFPSQNPSSNFINLSFSMASSSTKRPRGKKGSSSIASDFKDRSLIPPRYLQESFLTLKLPNVYAYLTRWNLLEFLCINEKVYPTLVREFYSKLKFENGCLVTKVKGFSILIDNELFTSLTGLTFNGTSLPGNGICPDEWLMDYSVENALSILMGPSSNRPGERNLVGKCPLHIRILHYILARALVPRSGNYAQLTHDDILLLWAITHDREVNWGLLICHHMMALKNKSNGMLPYGMLITKFLDSFNIPLDDEDALPVSNQWEVNSGTLRQMGYSYVAGSWVASGQEQHQEREDTPDPPAPDVLRAQAMMDFMQEQFQRLHTRFDSVDHTLHHLDARVARLESVVNPRSSSPPPPQSG